MWDNCQTIVHSAAHTEHHVACPCLLVYLFIHVNTGGQSWAVYHMWSLLPNQNEEWRHLWFSSETPRFHQPASLHTTDHSLALTEWSLKKSYLMRLWHAVHGHPNYQRGSLESNERQTSNRLYSLIPSRNHKRSSSEFPGLELPFLFSLGN